MGAPGGHGVGAGGAEDVPFVRIAGEDQPLGAELLDALEEGLEEGAGHSGGGAGDQEVDAGIAGEGEVVGEHGEGVAAWTRSPGRSRR